MKPINYALIGALALMLASCGTTAKFPVSDVVPAADFSVKKRQDKNDNFKIQITAKNLASPERLNPPRSSYVVWIKTYEGYRNIGQLNIKNAKKAELNTLSPHPFTEVLITAEDSGATDSPAGPYITSTIFEK